MCSQIAAAAVVDARERASCFAPDESTKVCSSDGGRQPRRRRWRRRRSSWPVAFFAAAVSRHRDCCLLVVFVAVTCRDVGALGCSVVRFARKIAALQFCKVCERSPHARARARAVCRTRIAAQRGFDSSHIARNLSVCLISSRLQAIKLENFFVLRPLALMARVSAGDIQAKMALI